MIEAFYEIPNKSVDKTKSWYSIKDKILYAKGINAKYFLEVIQTKNNEQHHLIILSDNPVHKSCRRCNFDNYGRLKLKLKHHNKFIEDFIDKDSNINLDYVEDGVENAIPYIVYKVSVN